jgi:hypothetical protein
VVAAIRHKRSKTLVVHLYLCHGAYPADLGKYRLQIQIKDYSRGSILGGVTPKLFGAITFPIPNNLVDAQQLRYSEESLGIAVGTLAETAKGLENFWGKVSEADRKLGSGDSVLGMGLELGSGVGGFVGNATAALKNFSAITPNPHLVVVFDQPILKTHEFQWRFSPETRAESDRLNTILNTLKNKARPVNLGPLLGFPAVFYLSLQPNEQYLYTFKPCIIESIAVHYSPTGVPSFFNSTAPAEVELTIIFKEIEIWTQT